MIGDVWYWNLYYQIETHEPQHGKPIPQFLFFNSYLETRRMLNTAHHIFMT